MKQEDEQSYIVSLLCLQFIHFCANIA